MTDRADDLTDDALAPFVGEHALRSHQVLLSAAPTAIEWAGSGAPDGAVVVADYQISPRGSGGKPWKMTPGQGLGFAIIMRPQLPADREGWLYTVVITALADACGDGARIVWPDEVRSDDALLATTGIEVRLGTQGVKWAIVNVLIPDAQPPRGPLLEKVLAGIDARLAAEPDAVLEDYRPRCDTIGSEVRIKLLGGSMRISGTALEIDRDGALVVQSGEDRRVPVRPQDVRTIDRD